MRKRKTFKTMELDERLAVRREMVRQAERILRENYPAMGPGADSGSQANHTQAAIN